MVHGQQEGSWADAYMHMLMSFHPAQQHSRYIAFLHRSANSSAYGETYAGLQSVERLTGGRTMVQAKSKLEL